MGVGMSCRFSEALNSSRSIIDDSWSPQSYVITGKFYFETTI